MKKTPFLIFAFIMTLLIGGVILFIQSPQFARVFKSVLARYIPRDVGIAGDFSEFNVKLFPPGVSIQNPKIRLLEHNIANLPPGSTISAERIDLTFRPVQMFSGNIRIHEVTVVNGDVRLLLGSALPKKPQKKTFKMDFHWDELFQIHAEAVSIRNTKLHIESANPAITVDFVADSLRVGQWRGPGGLGYELDLEVSKIHGSFLKDWMLPRVIDRLGAKVHVNARGLIVEALDLMAPGLDVTVSGAVKGNVLDPKNLTLDGDLNLRTDLARLREILGTNAKALADAAGAVSFVGKVHGSPERLSETLRLEGMVNGKNMSFKKWTAESLHAQLAWTASSQGGELVVTKATVASREQARVGNSEPARGGKIEVGAFKVNFEKLAAGIGFTVPLVLERAHVHWLAAPAVKQIFGLGLRASGPLAVTYHPAIGKKSWNLDTQIALNVDDFQLDNQRIGKKKALSKILAVSKIRLNGNVSVDSSGIRPVNLVVATGGTTNLEGNGKIDFKTGFDLFFTGPVDLADVGQIAENDIRGKGTLDCHVRGLSSSVYLDFDPDLTEARYLRLDLGNLKGRITWDDDKNRLLFTKMMASRGSTPYQGEGLIDLDHDKDTIDLNIHIPGGDIHDLSGVFDNLTHDIWWYPRELTGAVRGDVKISGGISMDKLMVDAKVTGRDWQQWGERLDTVSLHGGYDRGKYQITDFKGVKRVGTAYGRISFDRDRVVDWGFHTENFTLGDFDHLASLDVPMRGNLLIESAGKGKEGAIKSSTQFQLEDFAVRGLQMPPSHLNVQTESGKAVVKGLALGGQGLLDIVYDFNPGKVSSLKGELKHLDFSPVLLLINPRLIQDKALVGNVTGAIDLAFESGQIERASGNIDLSEYNLAKSGTSFAISGPVAVKVKDGSFDLHDLELRGNQSEAVLNLQSRRGLLEGGITGDIDVGVVEFFTSAIAQSAGEVTLDFMLGGEVKAPTISGKAMVDGVSLRVPSVESPFENVAGALQLRQNTITVQNLRADLAGGRVTAEGTIELFADRYPLIELKSVLTGSKLKVYPFQFVKVHGGLGVHGDKLPYLVEGTVIIDSALSKEKVFSQKKGEALKSLQYTPPPSNRLSSDYPKFKLNINASAENGLLIQNDLFDLEAKGRFTIVNTLEAPRILGSAEVISGKMLFKDRNFQIQSANAVFDNPTVINPSFNLSANTDVNGTKIQLYVAGRLEKWAIELSSNPVMPESEIISLLALGVTSGDARRLSATDRTAVEQGEAASLLLHSLDFNREVENKTGLQIKLDESINPNQQGTSIFKAQSSAESIAQPKIVIKRQIGKRFDLSYGTTVGGANSSGQKEVNAEFHFTPGFSALGVWDSYETIDSQNSGVGALQQKISIGLDLKFQTRFK